MFNKESFVAQRWAEESCCIGCYADTRSFKFYKDYFYNLLSYPHTAYTTQIFLFQKVCARSVSKKKNTRFCWFFTGHRGSNHANIVQSCRPYLGTRMSELQCFCSTVFGTIANLCPTLQRGFSLTECALWACTTCRVIYEKVWRAVLHPIILCVRIGCNCGLWG